MREKRGFHCCLWRHVVSVAAIGVFTVGLTLYGAPPKELKVAGKTSSEGAERVTAGPGIPLHGDIPFFPPVVVDYRDKDPITYVGEGARSLGIGEALWEPFSTVLKADSGDACLINEQCYTCNICIDPECTDFVCVEDVLSGQIGVEGCDDGEYCNGQEMCDGGDCLPGTEVTCDEGQHCDEYHDTCRVNCTVDDDCDDSTYCTADTCDGGECVYSNACGPGARCLEPTEGGTEPVCVLGRCCEPGDPDLGCTRTTYADCDIAGGSNWLGGTASGNQVTCDDEACPSYGSGIVAGSNYTAVIGPFSHTDCDELITIGDDYKTWDHDSLDPSNQFLRVEMLRFVGAVLPGSEGGVRWSVEFRDKNGVFIENTFIPNSQNDQDGFGVRTVIFDPPLVTPTEGIVSFSVQANFGLDGRAQVYTTDSVENGTNNTGSMFIQRTGETQGSTINYLGICSGLTSGGQYCDPTQGNADCAGGAESCVDLDDVLAFELIGTTTTSPTGACCDSDTAGCTQSLPWECQGAFQGEGSLCGICEDGMTACDDDEDCTVECLPISACENAACCNNNTGACRLVQTAEACDDGNTETFLGFGTTCEPNCCEQPTYVGYDDCRTAGDNAVLVTVPPLGGGTVEVTITGNNSAATFGDTDLICLDGPFAGNSCDNGSGVADPDQCGECIGGSNAGAPCSANEQCDSAVCNSGECNALCGAAWLDPEGGTRDPGWWVAFTLTACAEVRIDFCCTDIEGDVLRPAWAQLYGACPCDDLQTYIGVTQPVGEGRGTAGFARGAPFCVADNLWTTFLLPEGTYYYPVYSAPGGTSGPPGANYQFHIVAQACPIAACCADTTCQVVTELECQDLDGYWLVGNVDCGSDPDCTLPPDQTDNPCCTGSCCTATGCIDRTPANQPMTEPDCELENGDYVGGARCSWDPDPCPICPVESDINCQPSSRETVYPADVDVHPDLRRVDDFIATAEELNHVCVVGSWIDDTVDCNTPAGPNRCDCSCVDDDQANCVPQVTTTFTVCVYEDAGLAPGFSSIPGAELGCTTTDEQRLNITYPDDGWNFDEWMISLGLDSPFTLTPGQIYWLEVSASSPLPEGNTCNWNWAQDAAISDGGGGNDWHMFDFNQVWEGGDGRGNDMAMCLNMPLTVPAAAPGACCLCDPLGDCIDDYTLAECNELLGAWRIAQTCGVGTCPQTRPANDDCLTWMMPVTDGLVPFNNLCATTDGPDTVPCRIDPGDPMGSDDVDIGADVWFAYTATCSGRLTIRMCDDADYDSALAVYSDGTPNCVCPTDDTFIVDCGDDTCGVGGGPPEVEMIVDAGVCYTLQFAGWRDTDTQNPVVECVNGCQGSGSFTINCEAVDCPISSAARQDPVTPDQGNGTKNRYLSFQAGDAGQQQAVRVTFTSMPPGFEYAEGRTMWVQEPFLVTEASGSNQPVPPPTFWAAVLGCGPFYTDWTVYGTVDVYNDGLIPDGVYDVQVIHLDCSAGDEDSYSPSLSVVQSKIGDVVRDCGTLPCTPPNGVIDFVDISAVVEKFKNVPGAPRKARADVINSDISQALPDRKVDFVDISYIVDAFRNSAADPVGPPITNPCAP